MPYFDILNTPVASIQECYNLCMKNDNCIAFVVNDCQQPMTCWLKHS